MTDRDLELLTFVAEHRLVVLDQARALLGVSKSATSKRLSALRAASLLRKPRPVFDRQPGCFQITTLGLAALGSDLPPPRFDLHSYRHDVGVGWLWLGARSGAFGPVSEIIGERQLRSRDGRPERSGEPLGVRLGGFGAGGGERLHYPDLLLVTPGGYRIALELELSRKGLARREKILAGYGADPRVGVVLYLVENKALARSIVATARTLGLSSLIRVQPVRWAEGKLPTGPVRQPARAHAPARATAQTEL